MNIGFLLNHDAAHQVLHCTPTAFELARRYAGSGLSISIISTTEEETEAVKEIAAAYPPNLCGMITAEAPFYARWFDRFTGHALLAKRFAVLWRHRKLFRSLDALVVPDKTSLVLKRWLGRDCPKIINTFHGAGDRSGGYKGVEKFDYHLLPGPKYRGRMLAEGLVDPDRCAVVGYVKFDHIRDTPRPGLFRNDRPTVLYAPHFDPKYSSWFYWGKTILDYFAGNEKYNLIFAPHVLLFRRRWHISTEGGTPRFTPAIPQSCKEAENLIIDPGSIASIDMTYTRAADIYLGDVSSLVYEFLYDPKPCIFLNPAQAKWENNPNFRFWHLGEVLTSTEPLGQTLDNARANHQSYREKQREAVKEAFDLNETPSSVRAADAIAGFLSVRSPEVS